MTMFLSARKPQMALTALLIILTTLLAACGDNTPTNPPATTLAAATTAAGTSTAATSAATTAAGTTAAGTTAAGTSAVTTAAATTAVAVAPSGPATKLTIFIPASANLDTNSFTKEMSQKLNVNFTFQVTTLDGTQAKEKRQIALASGDYPDAFMLIPWVDQFSQSELLKYAKQGVVLPLNDLIKQYAPNIQAAMDKYPDFKAMATAPDGNIYGLPQLIDCYHCTYPNKLWMNSEWLKKLGLKQPTTTQEMKDVLTAFKTKDPNGNGKADEVPLSADTRDALIPYFMNAFIYDPQPQSTTGSNTSLVLNNGKADINANKDGWKQGLAYIKSLYDAGLIDQGAFTQNPDALKQIGDNAGGVILGGATVIHPAIFFTLGSPDGRDKQYDAVPPIKGPGGAQYATFNSSMTPGASFVLTNKASKEAQIAAIKLIDYVFDPSNGFENQNRAMWGEEGKTWRQPNPGEVATESGATPLYALIPPKPGDDPNTIGWAAALQYFMPKAYYDGGTASTDIYSVDGFGRRLQDATHLYDGKAPQDQIYPTWGVWVDPALGSELATLQTNIDSYVTQNALQFITGSKSLDKDWDSYVKGLDQLGLKRFLEIYQQAYDNSTFKK